jgi:hypothetical protein
MILTGENRSVEYWWNNTDRASRNTGGGGGGGTCPPVALCTINPRWAGLGLKLGRRSKRPLTNFLSHGTDVQKPRTQYLIYEFVMKQLIIYMGHKTGFMTGDGDEIS